MQVATPVGRPALPQLVGMLAQTKPSSGAIRTALIVSGVAAVAVVALAVFGHRTMR